jgi:hypothetical protein
MEQSEEGNGGLKPCWLAHDCQLAKDQRDGNAIAREMLSELRAMRECLVGPATGRKQVSSLIFLGTVIPLVVLVLVLIMRDSQKEFHATGPGGSSIHLENFKEKKTP